MIVFVFLNGLEKVEYNHQAVPFRRLCGHLGLTTGVIAWGASILSTSLLSQLSTLGTTSLALRAHAPKRGKGAGLDRRHPTTRLAWGCHRIVWWCRTVSWHTVAADVVGNRGASSVIWALLARRAGGGARLLCGCWLTGWGSRTNLCKKGSIQWLWWEVWS